MRLGALTGGPLAAVQPRLREVADRVGAPLGGGAGVVGVADIGAAHRVKRGGQRLTGQGVKGGAQLPQPVDAAVQPRFAAQVAAVRVGDARPRILVRVVGVGAVGVGQIAHPGHRPAHIARLGGLGQVDQRLLGGLDGGHAGRYGRAGDLGGVRPADPAGRKTGGQPGQVAQPAGRLHLRGRRAPVGAGASPQPRRRGDRPVGAVGLTGVDPLDDPQPRAGQPVGLGLQPHRRVQERLVGLQVQVD
nr:hypothetical protein [Euzebyales bacterium]